MNFQFCGMENIKLFIGKCLVSISNEFKGSGEGWVYKTNFHTLAQLLCKACLTQLLT